MTVRVGAFSLSAFVGGAERWMLDLIRHTKGPDVDWRWLVIGDESVNAAPILAEAASLLPVRPVSQLGTLANEVDVIVGWGLTPNRVKTPVIVSSHWDGQSTYGSSVLAQSVGAAAVVAVSNIARSAVPGHLLPVTSVIYNGVDPERVRPTLDRPTIRAQMGVSGNVLGYLGRLSTEKRLGALVTASARLPKNWSVCIVGAGNRNKIKHLLSRQPRAKIKFVDARTDVGNVLHAFDRLVLTSKHEGFGLVIAEAWMAGVPVISTRVGIVAEHPQFARVLEGGSDDAIGKQIASAVHDGQAYERAAAARAFAVEHLSAQVFGKRWTELLMRFSSDRATPSA